LLFSPAGKVTSLRGEGTSGKVFTVDGGVVVGEHGTPYHAVYAKRDSDEVAISDVLQAVVREISHQVPGVITCLAYKFNPTSQRVELLMELAHCTLADFMHCMDTDTKLKTKADTCIGFLSEVVPTLQALHAYGVVQVDLKPANIGLKGKLQEGTATLSKPGLQPLQYVLLDLSLNAYRSIKVGAVSVKVRPRTVCSYGSSCRNVVYSAQVRC
jgi:hypothetical protein